MMRIIACVDSSPSTSGVLQAAAALADLLGAGLDTITVLDGSDTTLSVAPLETRVIPGDPALQILEELRANDVVLGVLGSRSTRSPKLRATSPRLFWPLR